MVSPMNDLVPILRENCGMLIEKLLKITENNIYTNIHENDTVSTNNEAFIIAENILQDKVALSIPKQGIYQKTERKIDQNDEIVEYDNQLQSCVLLLPEDEPNMNIEIISKCLPCLAPKLENNLKILSDNLRNYFQQTKSELVDLPQLGVMFLGEDCFAVCDSFFYDFHSWRYYQKINGKIEFHKTSKYEVVPCIDLFTLLDNPSSTNECIAQFHDILLTFKRDEYNKLINIIKNGIDDITNTFNRNLTQQQNFVNACHEEYMKDKLEIAHGFLDTDCSPEKQIPKHQILKSRKEVIIQNTNQIDGKITFVDKVKKLFDTFIL